METKVYLIKGMYTDRVVLLFAVGKSTQSIILGYSELPYFFKEQQIQSITAGDNFEIYELQTHTFTIGKSVLKIVGDKRD